VLPHDAVHNAAYAVVRCRSVTFMYFVEMNKHIYIFSRLGSHTILVLQYQTLWQDFVTGAKSRLSGFVIDDCWSCWTVECRQRFDGGVIYSTKRRRLLIAADGQRSATHHWILFMTGSLDVTSKTTEQNLIVGIGKSEAEVTSKSQYNQTHNSIFQTPITHHTEGLIEASLCYNKSTYQHGPNAAV